MLGKKPETNSRVKIYGWPVFGGCEAKPIRQGPKGPRKMSELTTIQIPEKHRFKKVLRSPQDLSMKPNYNNSVICMVTAELRTATQKQVITYTGKDMGYLDAREFVRDKGGLPSNVLHDDILVRSEDWKQLRAQNYYSAWAREIYVYPEKNGRFEIGKNVVDAVVDNMGRQWVFPASLIPKEAFDMEKPSLFVDPGNDPKSIEVTDKRVAIAGTVSITVINPSIQINGQVGKVDEATRVPLYVDEALRSRLTDAEKRWLYRIDGAGVRPLVRDCDIVYCGRRGVVACCWLDDVFGVGWVSLAQAEHEEAKPSRAQAAAQAPNWRISLRSDAEVVEPVLPGLVQHMGTEVYESLVRLVRTAKEQK